MALIEFDTDSASTETISLLTGYNQGKIAELARTGLPFTQNGKGGKRYFNVQQTLEYLINSARREAASATTDDFALLVAERGEKGVNDYYRAQLLKLQIDKEHGRLVDIDVLKEQLRAIATEFRHSVQSLGGEMSIRLSKEIDPEVIKKAIDERIIEVLQGLHNKFCGAEDIVKEVEDGL